MNRPLKRLLGFTGAVLLGTLGAVALGSPAQAHHNTITAGAVCANGKIKITWSVTNSESDKRETITKVEKSHSAPIPGIAADTQIAKGATITGIQMVDANTTSAKLKLWARWQQRRYERQ